MAPINDQSQVQIRYLGRVPYLPVYHEMQLFTDRRTAETIDELWILEHLPVYTLGLAGKMEHLLNPQAIPVHRTDRGGQVTYHGPGQLVIYVLMNLERRSWHIKQLVNALEQAVINYLANHHLLGERRDHAPGVYVDGRKLSSLGLRIRRNCSYHGLSLNIAMDLTPFQGINPCGYQGLEMTQLCDLGVMGTFMEISQQFLPYLLKTLGYKQ
ncbi:MAG: octanoyltransferase [Beggiatoa sp. IS2]|nr:MAG: octanoyltransferase [Beggiatoa sp. IS2]